MASLVFLYEFTMGQLSVPWVNFSLHGSTFHGSTFHGSNCVLIRSTFLSVNVPMGLLSVGQTSNGSTKMSIGFHARSGIKMILDI